MNENRNKAIDMVNQHIASQGYPLGPCIGVECRTPISQTIWEIEFAWFGHETRSETTDPAFIIYRVNLDKNSISLLTPM